METFEFIAPCLFGLESLAADELRRMQIKNVRTETGRVRFSGGYEDLIKSNIRISTAERILIELGNFEVYSFNELFENVRNLAWETIIPKDGAFPVKGHCLNSKLMSVPDCQKIIKKAIAERMRQKYGQVYSPETGSKFQVQFSIMNDRASICIDTSGKGLHKRGYRAEGNLAPLRETLAAGMVRLSRYRGRDVFFDPFCGSGTIAIEAALAAINRAPGLNRRFAAMDWPCLNPLSWEQAKEAAKSEEYNNTYHIFCSDIDNKCIEIARNNAKLAGVEKHISFKCSDARQFKSQNSSGLIVTNPPYGERLMEQQDAEALYHDFGRAFRSLGNSWKLYLLSPHSEFEQIFGLTATKKRKLYNGMIKCNLFMYF